MKGTRRPGSTHTDRRTLLGTGVSAALMLSVPSTARASAGPEALTRYGRVRGFVRNGASIFLGLPYGADTSGERRFRPPAPPASWSEVRDATLPGQRAPQQAADMSQTPLGAYFTGGRAGELANTPQPMGEDCLVVNVVTPAVDRGARPVMVYIHGGGFTSGSGYVMTLGDAFAVREDVVLVTVNHRLGPLGYMYLGEISEELGTGNPGILDLIAALQWVRDNISHFGGDPEKVTIFGESGGGIKISYLLSMPEAQGLFRGAIIQSGLYPEPLSLTEATAATRAFMDKVGAPDIAALRKFPYENFVGAGLPGNRPVADGRSVRPEAWVRAPSTAARVPLMIGYCRDELTLFEVADAKAFDLAWDEVGERLAKRVAVPSKRASQVVRAYREAFPADSPTDSYFRISSDASFGRAMVTLADRKAGQRPPVYFYRMELDSRFPPGLRAFHTAELPLSVGLNLRPDAARLTAQISAAWAAFARTGNPNHPGLPAWEPYKPADERTMLFNVESRFGQDLQASPRQVLFAALAGAPHWNPL